MSLAVTGIRTSLTASLPAELAQSTHCRHSRSEKAVRAAEPLMRLATSLNASLTATDQPAKLNGHDPYAYLTDLLPRLPTQRACDIDDVSAPPLGAGNLTERSASVNMCSLAAYH